MASEDEATADTAETEEDEEEDEEREGNGRPTDMDSSSCSADESMSDEPRFNAPLAAARGVAAAALDTI